MTPACHLQANLARIRDRNSATPSVIRQRKLLQLSTKKEKYENNSYSDPISPRAGRGLCSPNSGGGFVIGVPRTTRRAPCDKGLLGETGEAGSFCTITSSNLPEIVAGSKVFYFQSPIG